MFSEIRAWLEPWHNKWAVMVLSAAVGLGAYEWICWSKLSASDWGTWVGAIGTVLTLIGTIWLATDGERRRRDEALDRAFVAAASLNTQLHKTKIALERGVEHFSDVAFTNNGFKYAVQAQLLEKAGIWDDEQILPLIVLPNHVCAQLAQIRPEIKELIADLQEMEQIQGYSWVEEDKARRDAKFLTRFILSSRIVSSCFSDCIDFIRAFEVERRRM